MKKILVCTDFSTTAQNAVKFAASVCKKYKAELHIMHVFEVPFVFSAGAGMFVGDVKDVQVKAEQKIKKIAEALKKEFKIVVKSGVVQGTIVQTVLNTLNKHRYDLLILGIQGNNKVKELLVGSTVVNLAGKTKCPLMVIPQGLKFSPFKKILFAGDDGKKLLSKELKLLKEWNTIQKLALTQFRIDNLEKETQAYAKNEIKELSKSISATLFPYRNIVFYSDNIIDGILWIQKKESAELTIVRSRHQNFFSKLFGISKTSELTFKTKSALLILSETK